MSDEQVTDNSQTQDTTQVTDAGKAKTKKSKSTEQEVTYLGDVEKAKKVKVAADSAATSIEVHGSGMTVYTY